MNIITTKKIIASAIISIMLMGLVTPIFAATTTTGTVKNNTYIYASKSTNGTKTAEIYKGQTVTVSSTNGDWCQVTWQVNTAYAHKSYVNSSNGKVKSGGPNLYSNYSNKKVSNKIGDLKQGNLKILDSKNYGNYYKVSVNVTGYIKKADLNIKTNTTSSTTSNKPTSSSSGSTTSILASLLQITFKGAETGIGIISSLLSRIGGGRPSKSLELNKTSITIEEGNTEKITAKVNNKTVTPTYTSSNTKIATVDKDGTIKAKGEGETKITARWDNKTATCKVTVTAKAQTSSSQQPTQSSNSSLKNTTVTKYSVVKTDTTNALPKPTKEQLEYIINNASITATSNNDRKRKDCLLENIEYFIYIQDTYNVNAIFAVAVAIEESEAGTSNNAVNKNNWFGIMKNGTAKSYKSAGECIIAFGKLIDGSNYFGNSKTTIESIGKVYCSPPNGWITAITSHMNALYHNAKD